MYKVQVHVKNSSHDTLVPAICSAVTLKALLESFYMEGAFIVWTEFVPGFYCAYEGRMLIGL